MKEETNKILHNFFTTDVVSIIKEKQKNPSVSNQEAIKILKRLSVDELIMREGYKIWKKKQIN